MRSRLSKFPFKTNESRLREPDGSTDLLGQKLRVLDVQFIQRFNVVAGKGYWNQEDVLPPPLAKSPDGLVRLRTQPGHRTDLREKEVNARRASRLPPSPRAPQPSAASLKTRPRSTPAVMGFGVSALKRESL